MGRRWKKLFAIWFLWSIVLAGFENIRMQIPMSMYLYEDEAVNVLSGNPKKISPEKIHLDFAGDIEIQKSREGNYQAVCKLFGVIPLKEVEIGTVSRQEVIPGGIPVGIYIQTDGVFVVGTGEIETEKGMVESPAKNVVRTGDYIIGVNGEPIDKKKELVELVQETNSDKVTLTIRRNEELLKTEVKIIEGTEGAGIGVWVRDDTQGVGTLTYVTADRKFGALGHGISDTDSELLMEISNGRLYDCKITGISKGKRGAPGKLSGTINYNVKNLYGKITGNLSGGIYGIANNQLMQMVTHTPMEISLKQNIKEGKACILSSVSGTIESYEIEIRKIHRGESDVNKGMEIEVTDERLLELTGGIVQGMSGSPIIQDGKLVGAVTHVLVNDPTRGYGIFIENMLEAAE